MWRHLGVPILYLQDSLGIINGTTGFYSKTMSTFPMHSLRLKNLDLKIGLISAFLRFLLSSEVRGDSQCQLTFFNLMLML